MLIGEASKTLGALNAATDSLNCTDAEYVGLQTSGTWAGTISFQGTVDGTNWQSLALVSAASTARTTGVVSTTGNGLWTGLVGGFRAVRAVMTAYTSGTATVSFIETAQVK